MKYTILLAALLTGCAQTEPIKFGIHQANGKKILVVEQRGSCDYRKDGGCFVQWADKVDEVWQIKYATDHARPHEFDHILGMRHGAWTKFVVHTKTGMQTVNCALVLDPGATQWRMHELMCADSEGYYASNDGRRNFDGGAK